MHLHTNSHTLHMTYGTHAVTAALWLHLVLPDLDAIGAKCCCLPDQKLCHLLFPSLVHSCPSALIKITEFDWPYKNVIQDLSFTNAFHNLKKKMQVIFKWHYAPDFVIPCGLSTLYRCSLTTVTQDKSYHEKPLIMDYCNHKESCTLVSPYSTITASISSVSFIWFYETISSEFLVQGKFKHTQFSREQWNWRDLNSQPLADSHPKWAPYRLS